LNKAVPLAILIAFSLEAQTPIVVVSAASYQPVVSPNSLASLFGTGLSDDTAAAQLDATGQLPTQLAGASVMINGNTAPLLYVSPTQINFLVPASTDIGTAAVIVQSVTQFIGTMQVRNVAPAIFSTAGSGQGPGAILNAVTFAGGPFLVETPANTGSDKRTRLAVFATGLRYAGNPAHDPAKANAAIQVQAHDHLGNVYAVEYAGAAPGFFGLDQINLIVPSAADGTGTLSLTIAAEGYVSNTVTFQMNSLPAGSVHLAGLSLAQTSATSGQDVSGTVALNALARSGGYTVQLGSSTLSAQVPTLVTVPAGQTTANFNVHTDNVGTTDTANITASANGLSQSAKLTVFPVNTFRVSSVSLTSNSVKGGNSITGTVTLSGNPPIDGATILLASDNDAVQVPASIHLSFGQTSASFNVATAAVADSQSVMITGTYGSSTAKTTLTVKPLFAIVLSVSFVTGGNAATGTITLTDPAPSGGATVALQSTDPTLASVPDSIRIAAGQTSATFTVATSSLTQPRTIAIAASYGGVAKPVLLAVNPPSLPTLTALTVNSKLTCTITISSPAPSNGLPIDLTADNPLALRLPPFVTIPSGQTSVSFQISTVAVSAPQAVTITASLGGVSKSATLTVQ